MRYMNKFLSLKIAMSLTFLLVFSLLGEDVQAQRVASPQQGRGVVERGSAHRSRQHLHKRKRTTIIVPEPEIVEEVIVPVEVVVVEHFDTIYTPVYYLPEPIKGHFSTYAGLRLSKADVAETLWSADASFKPGFNLGCRWDFYRVERKYSAYNALDLKYELSHYWVETADGYEHHSLNFMDFDYHFGFRYLRPNGDVCAVGFGPLFGFSPYGRTTTEERSYNSFEDGPFRYRFQYGVDLEVTYTHGNLFFCVDWMRTLNEFRMGETTIQVGRTLSINAGYRF